MPNLGCALGTKSAIYDCLVGFKINCVRRHDGIMVLFRWLSTENSDVSYVQGSRVMSVSDIGEYFLIEIFTHIVPNKLSKYHLITTHQPKQLSIHVLEYLRCLLRQHG